MTRVEWSKPAREDLDDLVRYIGRDSTLNARLFSERILSPRVGSRTFPSAVAASRKPRMTVSGRSSCKAIA
jgi:hypothetical protein